MLLGAGAGAIEHVQVATGDGEADAEAGGSGRFFAGAIDGADESFAQGIDTEALGEAELFGGCGEAIEVGIGIEDLPGAGGGPHGEHGFEKADAVLKAGIEG